MNGECCLERSRYVHVRAIQIVNHRRNLNLEIVYHRYLPVRFLNSVCLGCHLFIWKFFEMSNSLFLHFLEH